MSKCRCDTDDSSRCDGTCSEVTFQPCDQFVDEKPCMVELELCSCHMYREGARVERERIVAIVKDASIPVYRKGQILDQIEGMP